MASTPPPPPPSVTGRRASKSADEARRDEMGRIAKMSAVERAEMALRLGRRTREWQTAARSRDDGK
jgi:hypothetical protein